MTLDRTIVIRTAIALLDEVGLDNLTVRRLAERLKVQNPALYWHFKNKQDLLNGMAETILEDAFAGLLTSPTSDDWAYWLLQVAGRFHRALLAHRDGARVIAGADLSTSIQPVVLDLGLQILLKAGFDIQQALAGMVTVFDYTIGSAFEEQAEQNRQGVGEEAQTLPDPASLPVLATILQQMGSGNDPSRTRGFEVGLALIVAGLHAVLKPLPYGKE